MQSQPSKKARDAQPEDTVLRSLSKTERAKLAMDAWEPSLLRELLRPFRGSSNERRS